MKKQLLIAGLLYGLAALPASAQVAPTPNQEPGASTPGTPPTFPTDRQETSKDRQNRNDTDADTQQTGRDRLPQSDQEQSSQNSQSTDQDRSKPQEHRSEYQSQLETAMQKQHGLSGVHVNFTDTMVELTGAVPTSNDKHQARMMAQDYANGRKVVDHITVSGK